MLRRAGVEICGLDRRGHGRAPVMILYVVIIWGEKTMKVLSLEQLKVHLAAGSVVPERQHPYFLRWAGRLFQGQRGDQRFLEGVAT